MNTKKFQKAEAIILEDYIKRRHHLGILPFIFIALLIIAIAWLESICIECVGSSYYYVLNALIRCFIVFLAYISIEYICNEIKENRKRKLNMIQTIAKEISGKELAVSQTNNDKKMLEVAFENFFLILRIQGYKFDVFKCIDEKSISFVHDNNMQRIYTVSFLGRKKVKRLKELL